MNYAELTPNKCAAQRTDAMRFSLSVSGFFNIIGFGGRTLPALVIELGR